MDDCNIDWPMYSRYNDDDCRLAFAQLFPCSNVDGVRVIDQLEVTAVDRKPRLRQIQGGYH